MKTIPTTIIGLVIVILIGYEVQYRCNRPAKSSSATHQKITPVIESKMGVKKNKIVSQHLDPNIPSPREIQQMLKDTGVKRYDPGKIDGKIGRQTMRAWNNYTCDQFAIETFKPEYYEARK